ncbi:MAG: porin family protein, partial [Bacteroides sp.]
SMLGIYLAAGPDFFWNFKDLKSENAGDEKKNTQVALHLGAGVKLLKHLQVGVTYQLPMGDSFKLNNINYKTKTWQVSMAVLF